MLIFFVEFLKLVLLAGLLLSVWNLSITRLLMPKIFWLIALFVQLSFLLMLHGIEFISFVVLLLYVGAISVLFLFVVMILNPDAKRGLNSNNGSSSSAANLPTWMTAYYPLTPSLIALFVSLLVAEAYSLEFYSYTQGFWAELEPFLTKYDLLVKDGANAAAVSLEPTVASGFGTVNVSGLAPHSDLWFIAESFYTQDFVLFWLVGLILLVSMVGSILLTLQKSRGIKRQKGTNQSKRYHRFGR